MNCGTFEIQRIARAVKDVLSTFPQPECASCGASMLELHLSGDAYRCKACGAAVCVICGCTQERACEGGCSWAGVGFCSTHVNQLDEALARIARPHQARLSAVR